MRQTREGPAISRTRAAVFLTTLFFLLSAAAAHARPSFELEEPAGRAGDVVHFSISGAEGPVTYELEIGDEDVVEGAGGGGAVSGAFSVPDLGDAARTVTVEAEIRESGKRKKVKRRLEYLGPALPVTVPLGPAVPSPAPVVVPETAPSPEPTYSPKAADGTSPAPAVTPLSSHRPRQSRERSAIEPLRHVGRSGDRRRRAHRSRGRRKRDGATKRSRSKRLIPRTAPLFDGIPEPGWRSRSGDGDAFVGPIAPRAAVLAAAATRPGDGAGANAAVVVPALLGLGALTLLGAAVLRRRRLDSAGRD